jgi:hypothetical protein
MENVGIFYDHLEYFTAIWYNLWLFGVSCGHLVYFFPFWYVLTGKNLATLLRVMILCNCDFCVARRRASRSDAQNTVGVSRAISVEIIIRNF